MGLKSLFKPKRKPTLGLDIGSHSIKIVELESKGSRKIVQKVGRALLPQGAIVDGSIKDREVVEEVLRNLVNNLQPKLKRVSTSISGYSVIVKRVMVPYPTEKEIEDNLIIEAEKYVPFEIEDVYIDFSILNLPEDERGGANIYLVAAKKEVVDEYAGLLEDIGLVPSVIDVDAFTLANVFESVFGKEAEPAVLLDIGASNANMIIVIGGVPVFTRDMAFGGEQLTEAIQESTGLSREEAEKVKISGTKDTALMKEVSEIISTQVNLWIDEVGKALTFYKANAPENEHPQKIYLSGGCALLRGIEKRFSKGLKYEARILNVLEGFEATKTIDETYIKAVGPQMTIATGLALRSVE